MKPSILTAAAIMVLLAATMNRGVQPGHTHKGKVKNYPSYKAAVLHDNHYKKPHYDYNNHDSFIKYHGHYYKYSQGYFIKGIVAVSEWFPSIRDKGRLYS